MGRKAEIFRKDEEMKLIVKRVEQYNQKKARSLEHLQTALEVDWKSMKQLHKKARYRNLAQLVFFAVIMGCELDLLGFMGVFMEYWNLEKMLVRILLAAMPSAYAMCVGLYMAFIQPDENNVSTPCEQSNTNLSRGERAQNFIQRR